MSNIIDLCPEQRLRRGNPGTVSTRSVATDAKSLQAISILMTTKLRQLDHHLMKLKRIIHFETNSAAKGRLVKSITQAEIDIQEALVKWAVATDLLQQSPFAL